MTVAQPHTPPSRSGPGCLGGCLIALALLFVPVVLVAGYNAWFLWQGFRHDPALTAMGELVRHDGMAAAVLGEHIEITGVESNEFSFVPGFGSHSDYTVALHGSKASGTLTVDADVDHGHVHINSVILTGPAGDRYDLMRHTIAPSARPTTSI
jgi:hypothetical protein